MTEHHAPPALAWRKSSHSGACHNCVELARIFDGLAVRDSKNPGGPRLVLPLSAARRHITDIKSGGYDL